MGRDAGRHAKPRGRGVRVDAWEHGVLYGRHPPGAARVTAGQRIAQPLAECSRGGALGFRRGGALLLNLKKLWKFSQSPPALPLGRPPPPPPPLPGLEST